MEESEFFEVMQPLEYKTLVNLRIKNIYHEYYMNGY